MCNQNLPVSRLNRIGGRLCGILMILTAYLLTRKFGGLAVMTDAAGFFPEKFTDYFIVSLPAHAVGILSGILLLLTAVLLPAPDGTGKRSIVALLWSAGLLLAALPGCFSSGTDWDFAFAEVANIAGIGAWALALDRLLSFDERWGKRLAAAFMIGALVTACNGYWQYFFGFAEMKQFVAEQQSLGIAIPEALLKKLEDPRITSTMASSNALAGVLLLALMVTLYFAWNAGRKFEPQRISQPLFAVCAVLLVGGALVLSRSRSAFLGLVVTAGLAFLSAPTIKKRWKTAAVAAAVLAIAGGLFYAHKLGRGTASMVERADYLKSCAVLTAAHPLGGAGWGRFFYHHMRYKSSGTDEAARDPHNMIAAFAAQSGIPAALLAAAALLIPLMMLWKKRFAPWQGMVFWSGVLFTLHILMDSDFHIPSIPAAMLILYLSALPQESIAANDKLRRCFRVLFTGVTIFTALLAAALNIHFVRGEKAFADLSDKLQPSTPEIQQKWADTPVEKLRDKAQKLRPFNAMIPEMAGDYYLNLSDTYNASLNYEASAKINPMRPSIYRKKAMLAAMQGNSTLAGHLLDKAKKLFPKNRRYHRDHPDNREMLKRSVHNSR